ncbi:Unknown protein [Striga hermonthica]|uniref:Uncharacterized protein n=1 Tax=Striga hermonthica TaxID=68872 RepID=A0A9N7R4X7_STRHE|nr:Unknown protein [Striga hermonthica]
MASKRSDQTGAGNLTYLAFIWNSIQMLVGLALAIHEINICGCDTSEESGLSLIPNSFFWVNGSESNRTHGSLADPGEEAISVAPPAQSGELPSNSRSTPPSISNTQSSSWEKYLLGGTRGDEASSAPPATRDEAGPSRIGIENPSSVAPTQQDAPVPAAHPAAPNPPVIPQFLPLISDERSLFELTQALRISFFGRNQISDLLLFDRVLEIAVPIERNVEAALLDDGFDAERIHFRLNEIREVLFRQHNRLLSERALDHYLNEIRTKGTRHSTPYRRARNQSEDAAMHGNRLASFRPYIRRNFLGQRTLFRREMKVLSKIPGKCKQKG